MKREKKNSDLTVEKADRHYLNQSRQSRSTSVAQTNVDSMYP